MKLVALRPENIRPAVIPALVQDELKMIATIDDPISLWTRCGQWSAIGQYLKRSRQYNPEVIYVDLSIRRRIGELLGPKHQGKRGNGELQMRAVEVLTQTRINECRLLNIHWRLVEEKRPGSVRAAIRLIEESKRKPDKATPEIREGDFRKVLADVEDASVQLILTDPPYAKGAMPLYADLATFAARVLSDGGSLLCYCGQSTMYEAAGNFSKVLDYWWTLCLRHRSGNQMLPGKWIMIGWKPILWFVKGTRGGKDYVRDVLDGSKPAKDIHDWAQGEAEAGYLIERTTMPNDLVIDPFAGSGAFLRQAKLCGRRALGANVPGKVSK